MNKVQFSPRKVKLDCKLNEVVLKESQKQSCHDRRSDVCPLDADQSL